MKLNDALLHYGVMGMRWGVRKDAYQRINKARKKADLKQLKIYSHDRKQQLKAIESTLDPNDKEALKRYKLQKKALKAEIKARKVEIKLREPVKQVFNREGPSSDGGSRNESNFNNRFRNQNFAKRVSSKPMSEVKRDGVFKRTLTEVAIKGAGSAASSFTKPIGTHYGDEFVSYLVKKKY